MSDSNVEGKRPLWARCDGCGHTWPATNYPANLMALADALRHQQHCPVCGGQAMLARQADGQLLEDTADHNDA